MKFFKKSFALAAFAAIAVSQAAAADTIVVATGDSKGGSTYSQMFRELNGACQAVITLKERETTGSVQNVELLTGNQVNAAIVQSDMLFYTKITDEAKVSNVKTLFTLHPEELHFVARADVKKEGGILGFGAKEVSFRSVDDLAGRVVGAVGGSVLSGRVFASQSKLGFKIAEFATNEELKAALLSGAVDSILVVGGAPHKLVSSLDQNFRLLPVSPEIAKTVGGVYTPTKLSYGNLNQAGVPSVATQAMLVSRTYNSQEKQDALASLRGCFTKKLPLVKDTLGTHPKWQAVSATDNGKWAYYDLPAAK